MIVVHATSVDGQSFNLFHCGDVGGVNLVVIVTANLNVGGSGTTDKRKVWIQSLNTTPCA